MNKKLVAGISLLAAPLIVGVGVGIYREAQSLGWEVVVMNASMVFLVALSIVVGTYLIIKS